MKIDSDQKNVQNRNRTEQRAEQSEKKLLCSETRLNNHKTNARMAKTA